MTLSIRQIHPVFVGEVSGVDVTRPLASDDVAALEAGMDRYAVLVFHDQPLTDEQQMAFARQFGALEDARGGNITKRTTRSWAATRASACSTWATCSGTPTPPSAPSPPSTRSCPPAW
jgi:hypothetical protein